ncbi:MAG TPA: hypothetical protein VL098_12975 [Flavipsychrobacter sp.]|nr:hypothetical protein [Flavipsychrobacter sp.]
MLRSENKILKNLKEIERLNIDKESLEIAKKYQEFQQAQKPYWKTPSFITVVISAASIIITGFLGYGQLLQRKNQEIENQKKAFEKEKETAAREFENQKMIIQNFLNDTLKASSQRAAINLQIASLALQDASKNLQDQLSKNVDANFQLIEIRRNTDYLNDQKNKLDKYNNELVDHQKMLSDSIRLAKQEQRKIDSTHRQLLGNVNKITFEREKEEALKLLYSLKSTLITFITPSKNTFSGALVTTVNIPDEVRKKNLHDLLSQISQNRFLKNLQISNSSFTNDFGTLNNDIKNLQYKFQSNKLLRNSKYYLKHINPRIDNIIAKIDSVSFHA